MTVSKLRGAIKFSWSSCLLINRMADRLETLYVAFEDLVLWNFYKWWPWLDHYLFNGKVKFGPQGFEMEKAEKSQFRWCFHALLYGTAIRFNSFEIFEVKVICWPCLKVNCPLSVKISDNLSFKTTKSVSINFGIQYSWLIKVATGLQKQLHYKF